MGGREGGGGSGGENLNSDVQAIISLHKPIITIITLTVEPLKATMYGLHILFYGLHILLYSKIFSPYFILLEYEKFPPEDILNVECGVFMMRFPSDGDVPQICACYSCIVLGRRYAKPVSLNYTTLL